MKIVQLITGTANFGGAQAHVRDLATGLQAYNHECVVVTGPPAGLFTGQLGERGIQVVSLPHLGRALNPFNDVTALFELVIALKKIKPDLVAAHTAKAGFLGRVACAFLGIPCVFTPHGWSIVNRVTGEINPVFWLLERVAGSLGHGVITVCRDEYETGKASRLVKEQKLFCVYNGIPDAGAPVAGSVKGALTVVMVARFQKQKDHATLLRALGTLPQYPWRLKLAGSGPLFEETRQLAVSLGLEDRVEFLGQCDHMTELLSDAAIFALSTFYEAFPISILEAMRAGLPVVATNVGGIAEAVADGVSGFVLPPAREDLMAASLEKLFQDATLRDRFGRSGREIFLERFTDKKMILQTIEVYGLVAHRGARPEKTDSAAYAPVGTRSTGA